jgi:hypothetical protein
MRTIVYAIVESNWVEVGNGATSITVQLLSNGPIYLFATDDVALPNANDLGMILSRTGPDPVAFSLNAVPTGGKIYLRCAQDEINRASVMTIGETVA